MIASASSQILVSKISLIMPGAGEPSSERCIHATCRKRPVHPDVPSPELRYTLVILSKSVNLLDMQTMFATGDEETIILSKMIAEG
ncbi:hypothetical protein [Methylobacterium nonmethylotrophicum]|uniref:Uncharacterized protein n=1 Tax=Methylobacterium nonmethylotrophicum TaxID=1141884 RepID=A0A4Z0NMB9_9HYPH|nr:hypothetical protein [Methylobacterium nonmethylotrophicum]TGD97718.1 hypothetical protein EU555_19000 [Methylobacterium nonmethylotrophicum]